MYDAGAPCFAGMLRELDAIRARTQSRAVAKKIDPAVLLGARQSPDMGPGGRAPMTSDENYDICRNVLEPYIDAGVQEIRKAGPTPSGPGLIS